MACKGVLENNAASAEESAAAAEELNAQSAELKALVEKLGLMVGVGQISESKALRAPKLENSMSPALVAAHESSGHSRLPTGRSQKGFRNGAEVSAS